MPIGRLLDVGRWPSLKALVGISTFSALFWVALGSGLQLPAPATGTLLILSQIVIFAFWCANRRLPRFGANEVGIVVALACEGSAANLPAVQSVLLRFIQQLQQEANAPEVRKRSVRVRVVQLKPHHSIGSHEEADTVLTRSRGAYAVWASGTAGHLDGEPCISFDSVSFTVRHRPLGQQQAAALVSDLALAGGGFRGVKVRLTNDVEELPVVSRHLALIARYHLGLALGVSGIRDASVGLLTSVFNASTDPAPLPYQKKARQSVAILLVGPWMEKWPVPGTPRPECEAARQDASEALGADPTYEPAYELLANAEFLLGDAAAAHRTNDLMKPKLARENGGIFHLNRAVFYLATERFDLALGEYRRAVRLSPSLEALQSTLTWLYAAVDEGQNRFLLGVAVLNQEWFDAELARTQFREALEHLPAGSKAYRYALSVVEPSERPSGLPHNGGGSIRTTTSKRGRRARRGGLSANPQT